MKSSSSYITESFARFLNALASFVLGRQYLTSNPKLLEILVQHLLESEQREDVILDMILGTLKKLSIRRVSQAFMVDNGVVEWLAKAFHLKAPITNYAISSSIALLFNLSLCPLGKKRCEPLKVELISGLGYLLKLQDSKISPYVNGTLYRILSIPSVREYAKEQALPNALKKLLQKVDGEPKKQLETILELFVTDVQIEDGSSDEEDDDQEDDSLEPEIDLNDNVTPDNNEVTGEDLLKLYYNEKKNISTPVKKHSSVHSKSVAQSSPKCNKQKKEQETGIATELSTKKDSLQNDSIYTEQPLTPKLDLEATQLVRRIVGSPSTTLVEAAVVPDPAAVTIKGLNANEYTVAFSSRPKIPRTPEPGDAVSPKVASSSPLRTIHKEFNSPLNNHRIYCK